MSVVIAKSVCLNFSDSISFEIVCFTDSSIMWFGQPGHQVTSEEVPSSFAFGLLVVRFAGSSLRW